MVFWTVMIQSSTVFTTVTVGFRAMPGKVGEAVNPSPVTTMEPTPIDAPTTGAPKNYRRQADSTRMFTTLGAAGFGTDQEMFM